MNRGPAQDPGEDPPPPGSSTDQETGSTDLKDQFDQQQLLIAQLKEMLRKTDQSNVTQEKVDRYASTLSKMTVRAKKSKLRKESSGTSEKTGTQSGIEAPVNEKMILLRRQLEENKAKLEQRGKNQKGIEEMVTQLRAQFDDSLQLINDTSSNFSFCETKTDYSKDSSAEELYNILVSKEKRISDLNSKVQKLEANVLDLQENLKEKDCVIDARTKAITLMTESLSKKGKNTQDTLDETKQQMRKMQEDFVKLEDEMKARQMKLLDELRLKNLEIAELQEINSNIQTKYEEPVQSLALGNVEEINELRREMQNLLNKIQDIEAENSDLIKENKELEEVNKKIKTDNEELKVALESRQVELEESRRKVIELECSIENLNKISKESSQTELEESRRKITELESVIEKLNEKSREAEEKVDNQLNEINQLRGNLDEVNKNIIKMKAEHKKKIKTLNKKVDSFKKIGDLNGYIVELTGENESLKEKIAELEEEKGNYQLKLMDSKDSQSEENVEELNTKIKELTETLEEQAKKLEDSLLENATLTKQIESSNDKLQKLSDLQNEKVTTEMASIQLEELSEELKREKTEISSAKEKLQNENSELVHNIETLNREKLEMQLKLDQYIHENMELIDKLEKLSAEKVSSAESIEIVENLTHQEKLELEEFQKSLDPQSGKLKMSEEQLEGTPDLNDSVNQLTEETSELLQKIELFTIERREVMEKMESLTTENNHLNLKLKQIENNRDLLTETYEQLQSEKEELDNKIQTLERENGQLKEDIETMKTDFNVRDNEDLKKKLYDLEGEYIQLREENENLLKNLKKNAEVIHEKDNLDSELKKARYNIQELETKLVKSLEEINVYQSVIEDNKEEFIRSATHLNELKDIINAKETEIEKCKAEISNLNSTIADFNETISNLENENKHNKENINKIDFLEDQLEELKGTLNNNLAQIGDYETELEENSKHMKELNQRLKELSNKNLELQNMLEGKNEDYNKVIKGLNEKIEDLMQQIKFKDESFHKVSSDMKDKFILLQKQTDTNTEHLEDIREPLQKKIEELTAKNNTLIEKTKKIAANLKKKTQTCQNLEQQLLSKQEKWETELNEKNIYIKETEGKIEELRIEADMYKAEVNQLKEMLDEKIQKDVPQSHAFAVRSEISLQEELSGSSIVPETISKSSSDTTFSKIQELELIIETQENDIRNYKERISCLEETLSKIDERRETLEQKTNLLGVQLQEKSQSFEEISKTEDILEEKLRSLSKYNEEVEKKLEEITKENENLISENNKLKSVKEKLKQKLIISQERVNELLKVQQNATVLEQELEKSTNQISNLEQEARRLDLERVQLEESSKTDLEKLDNDWQLQFEVLSKEKSELGVVCEKLNETISELTETERVSTEKINELESKLEKCLELQETSDVELLSQRDQIEKLTVLLESKSSEVEHHLTELKNFESLKLNESSLIAERDNLRIEIDNLKSQLDELVNELNNVRNSFLQTQNEVSGLKMMNEELQNRLEIQSTNRERQEEPKKVESLFSFQEQEQDPFSFISADDKNEPVQQGLQEDHFSITCEGQSQKGSQQISNIENSRDELLQKIRTLEFMLKDMEYERDDVLNQCSHLSNELMRFVYERGDENAMKQYSATFETVDSTKISVPVNEPLCVKKEAYLCYPDGNQAEEEKVLPSVESQVLPSDSIEDTAQTKIELQRIEFTESKDIVANRLTSDEEPCQKQQAYLCYPQDKSEVESQVFPATYFKDSKETSEELHAMEFVETQEFVEHQHPVQETPCQKKEAYLCTPDQVNLDTFSGDDDGWGWNPEEARLEEQHNKEYEANPLRIQITELQNKIRAMEIERDDRYKEYQELQVKSGKLIKKLKEMKIKNEKLEQGRKQEDMFNLEDAIQEELKNQIQSLEKKIHEVGNELTKEKSDKQTLQKKMESLVSTNHRMAEMKEKQDIEMLMWKRKTEELKSKLDQFEWGESSGSPEKTKKHTEELDKISEEDISKLYNTLAELNETIKELTLDNEDLQTLLEEQRSLRIAAEKSKSAEPIADNMKTEKEYMEILKQKQTLENEINNISSENKRLQTELNMIIKNNDERLEEFQKLQDEKEQYQKFIEERDEIVKKLTLNLEQVQIQNDELSKLLTEKSHEEYKVHELSQKIRELEEEHKVNSSQEVAILSKEKGDLMQELQEKSSAIEVMLQDKEKLLKDLNEKDCEIQNINLKIEEKTSFLSNQLEDQMKTIERLMNENETLKMKKEELEKQIQIISEQILAKDVDFESQMLKLNQEWQVLVDQRGSDVAESWKLHLDSRETEFSQIQEQLRKEINDLEEKCNGLVNENNELRKNVDTEIRNEVDRMSALQQQINERQQYINDLSKALQDKQLQLERSEEQILQLQNTITDLQKSIEYKDVKINEFQIIVDATQKQFDEKRVIVEGIVKKLEERSSSPILFDLESITEALKRQVDSAVSQEELSKLYKDISDKDSIISNMQNELASKVQEIDNCHVSIDNYKAIVEELKTKLETFVEEEKLNEVSTKLKEKETLLLNIQNELEAVSKESSASLKKIEEYKSIVSENEIQVKELTDKLLEKDEIITNLTYQLQQTQSLKENENENVQNLQYSLQQYQLQYDELRSNLSEKGSLVDSMNAELEKQHKIHLEREAEVQNLKMYVEELQKSHNFEKEQLDKDKNGIIETQSQEIDVLRSQLSQTQLYIDEISSDKEMVQESLNYLQLQLQEKNGNIEELSRQIESFKSMNVQMSQKLNEYEEQNILRNETEKQIADLKEIIEEQVLKIEDLKQKLYEKSNDYDSLIAEMDVRKEDLRIPDQVAASARPPMGQGQLIGPTCEDDLNEWVSRPELDIALYMLHQRDVRCEELTVELTQLLQERDTLQLRLSNALREKEEFRKIAVESGKPLDNFSESSRASPSKGAIPKGRVSEIVLKSSGTELALEAQESSVKESDYQLANKLSELKNIGYKRDKTLLDEQQQRRLQQLSIMQHHMDEASKLPPEAAARLVDANYTLSRDVQSPSKVLLNWLWGRSTPKVNEL